MDVLSFCGCPELSGEDGISEKEASAIYWDAVHEGCGCPDDHVEIMDVLEGIDENKDGQITPEEVDKDGDGFIDYERIAGLGLYQAIGAHNALWGRASRYLPNAEVSRDVRANIIKQQNGNPDAEAGVVKKLESVQKEEFSLFKSEAGQIAAFESIMKVHRDETIPFFDRLSDVDFEMFLDQAVSERVIKVIEQARSEYGCAR